MLVHINISLEVFGLPLASRVHHCLNRTSRLFLEAKLKQELVVLFLLLLGVFDSCCSLAFLVASKLLLLSILHLDTNGGVNGLVLVCLGRVHLLFGLYDVHDSLTVGLDEHSLLEQELYGFHVKHTSFNHFILDFHILLVRSESCE